MDDTPASGFSSISKSWCLSANGKSYTLQYDDGFLTWEVSNGKPGTDTSSSTRKASFRKIGIRHVLSIVIDENKEGFSINFIDIRPKFFWKRGLQKFNSSEGDGSCESVVAFIEDKLNQVKEKPRKLLVYVNPCSGKSKGVSVHKKYVVPLLQLANIEAETLVTTHGGHIKEHLQTVDLSTVDGVVTVGGDGTFTEAFEALVKRNAKEAGVDIIQDPEAKLTPVKMRLGIVPAGTGQGMVFGATGTYDPETAVLHIIAGYSNSMDGLSVHNGDKLMAIGSMLFGYGFFGDVIKLSEDNRQMGRMRYLYAMVKGLVKYRTVDVELSYIKAPNVNDCGNQNISAISGTEEGSSQSGASAGGSEWTQADGFFKGVSGFLITIDEDYSHSMVVQLARSTMSRTKFLKELYKIRKMFEVLMQATDTKENSKSTSSSSDKKSESSKCGGTSSTESENISELKIPTKAVRLKLKNHSETSLAELSAEMREVMNVDGEAFTLTHPQVEIRVHADVLPMFGLGYKNLRKPEWYGTKTNNIGNP